MGYKYGSDITRYFLNIQVRIQIQGGKKYGGEY